MYDWRSDTEKKRAERTPAGFETVQERLRRITDEARALHSEIDAFVNREGAPSKVIPFRRRDRDK